MNFLIHIREVILSGGLYYVAGALLLALLLVLLINTRQRSKIKELKIQTETINKILTSFQPEKGLDKNLADLLGLVVPLVAADGYYFYLLEPKSNKYVLKAVRHIDANSGYIEPSYSGLSPYQKETYSPPLGIPAGQQPARTSVIKDGEVPLLVLPVKGGLGLIRVGPVHKVPKGTPALLDYLGDKLQPVLDMTVQIEKMKNQVESVSASSEAIRSLTRSALDLDGSLSTIMGLSIKMIEAAGGCFLYGGDNRVETAVVFGLDKGTEELFRRDRDAQFSLHRLVEDKELLLLTRDVKDYIYIPSYFAAAGINAMLMVRVNGKAIGATAIFWYYNTPDLEQHRVSALQMLIRRMEDALDKQLQFKELTGSYIDMLKMLVSTVDNLEPYTVGHSELISRYSGIMAREMKLSIKEVNDITLAGYLHDVGMLGLSGDILFKSGKYTDVEYETMKLHADVGASIIESIISNNDVADCIRHHHERFDGYGYPQGLKGEQIPLGSRIIAVADMFNAKITGRRYREPVSFEKAITDLRGASGTQLDPMVVEALIGWFRKKQTAYLKQARSLGPCWEMRCCPSYIARHCPAYQKSDRNCWEIEGINCEKHGNSCSTCIIYTEFIYRSRNTALNKRLAGRN